MRPMCYRRGFAPVHKPRDIAPREPWLYGVRVRKIGRLFVISTPHKSVAYGKSRIEAMVNYVRRKEADRAKDNADSLVQL